MVVIEINSTKKSSGFRHLLLSNDRRKSLQGSCPKFIKNITRRWLPRTYDAYCRSKWRAADPYANIEEVSIYPAKVNVKLGIIKEFAHAHKYYVGACRDLGVPYKILDISGSDWIDIIQNSGCDAFLAHPSCEFSTWKQMYDERLRIIVEDHGKIIYPTYNELWFYESKRRMCYWLQSHAMPHPQTWVFYNCDEALEFARNTTLPIVFKSDFGSAGSGVWIFRSRSKLMRHIKHCFSKGIIRKDEDLRDRSWGSVLLQEYLPDAREWRMIRIGNSYFGYEKVKVGDYASGSHRWSYSRPSDELLNLLKEVTDNGNFRSMSLDVLATPEGRYLISEMQTVFGMGHPYEMCVIDSKPGRMIYLSETQKWHFEEGSFCQNNLCNLRVQTLLTILGKKSPSMERGM